jgi:hypothetical protein
MVVSTSRPVPKLGRNTIKRILADYGIVPALERGKSMSWSPLFGRDITVHGVHGVCHVLGVNTIPMD